MSPGPGLPVSRPLVSSSIQTARPLQEEPGGKDYVNLQKWIFKKFGQEEKDQQKITKIGDKLDPGTI